MSLKAPFSNTKAFMAQKVTKSVIYELTAYGCVLFKILVATGKQISITHANLPEETLS